jgi:acylphosphatase
MADKVRAHVNIHGWVQGVAFRYNTQHAACDHQVFGWVRNRADGSVEAVFEGDKDNVDALLAWCEKGPKRAVVKEVNVEWETFTGDYSSFDIRF